MREILIQALMATSIFAHAQAGAVADYMWRESNFDPCAHSAMGEALVGVAGPMRRRYHRDLGPGCRSIDEQIAWLAKNWAGFYPECRRKFDQGDLSAFSRCWGRGSRH